MGTKDMEVGSKEYREFMDQLYNQKLIQYIDLMKHNDFAGLGGEEELSFLAEKLGLTQEAHLLDICSGIGGPARFLAKTYGCKVTGIDISEIFYKTAKTRTKEAGLDHLVNFIHDNALANLFPDQSFTHVFGCDAWSYFPDKMEVFKVAFRVLKPGGLISFMEAASDIPGLGVQADEFLGPGYHESTNNYLSILEMAGFVQVQFFNTTELVSKYIIRTIHNQISKRNKIITTIGLEAYFEMLAMWTEYLAFFAEGKMTHCCFIARKK